MTSAPELRSTRVKVNDSLEEINQHLYSEGYTDGLPVIPPTEERVVAMMAYMNRAPGDVVAQVSPERYDATIEKIAINAVMAGCLPEYMPVLIAAVEAMSEEHFNLHGIQATTNPVGPLLIINGPIRQQLEINCRSNAFGPGWRANATIGRAIRLILMNIGGASPGPVDKSTQGWPGKYSFCFGELEEENPWSPLHVERGFASEQSTVTVIGAQGTSSMLLSTPPTGDELIRGLARGMVNVCCNNHSHPQEGEPLLALCPSHASILARDGYTKESIKDYLWREVRMPLEWMPERAGQRAIDSGRVVDGMVPLASTPEQFMIVVVGGDGALHSTFIPTFADTWAVTRPIS